ncbi:VanW family protein [Sediminibacillus massiliensis]|uniref:VanW family protein n=1 Tax=Sediminibacillus massiliensis TaxID=1926277 RepID=UPI0009886CD6|nr:VanW family protein [Sediminibacillus massiliensis]
MKVALLSLLLFAAPQLAVSEELTIKFEGKDIKTIEKADLSLPHLNKEWVQPEKVDLLLKEIGDAVYKEPKDAYIDEHNNIVPGKAGHQLNLPQMKEAVYNYYYGSSAEKIEAPLQLAHPRVDGELLVSIREQLVGQYQTYFNSRNKERSHNIKLATEAIDNEVIFPGETFSFNQSVGKRTKEKGYQKAPVIVKGELAEDIGGGICQVSSTLYNAVDRAGVKITERYSHSRKVPYVPPGRDATVSWYGPDFAFQNTYNQPLLIRAKAGTGYVAIRVYSSEDLEYTPRQTPASSKELPKEVSTD